MQASLGAIALHALLILGAFMMVFPFLWMILTSLKDSSQAFLIPPQWIPNPVVWSNYPDSLQALPFGRAYFNSLYISLIVIVVTLLTSSMAAYAFAKIDFPFREPLFVLFLATMMVPQQVTIIPLYLIMRQIGWLDTHLALIVPGMGDVFGIFLLRQYFMSLPRELEDAARVEGAGFFRIYISIVLPLSRSALPVVAVLGFMSVWNSFLWPLIMLNYPNKFTLPVGLQLLNTQHSTDWTVLMAGDVVALLPVVIIYLLAQRYFVQGITMSGLKG